MVLSGSIARVVALTATIIGLTALDPAAPQTSPETVASDAPDQNASLERGKTIYNTRCAVCHGAQGKGDGPEAPFLSPRPSSLLSAATSVKSDAELLRIIEAGKPRTAMLAWKDRLSEAERQDVLAYIRSLIRFQQPLTPPPPK